MINRMESKNIVVYSGLSDDRQKFNWLCPVSNIYGELKVADYLECGNSFPSAANNFVLIDATVTDHRYLVQSPNADKTEFYLDLSITFDTLFPKQVIKPKAIEEYDLFMVQYRTTYTSEYDTRIFKDFAQAQDFFLQSKSEMIQDARSYDDYELNTDNETELSIDYGDRYHTITIEGIDLSDNDNSEKRSLFPNLSA